MFDLLDIGLFELLVVVLLLLAKKLIEHFVIDKILKSLIKKAKARFKKVRAGLKNMKARLSVKISWLRLNVSINVRIGFDDSDP